MLTVLSPAKTLDLQSPLTTRKSTQPRLLAQATELVEVLRGMSAGQLESLMGISPELAQLNVERYADFETPFTRRNARPALLLFNGDVYRGLDARHRFGERDFTEAQKSLRILSGLYGVLRPLDLIAPYRLEMGTRLATPRGATLYQWWGATITELLRADLAESPGAPVLVNLASAEYFGSVDPAVLGARIVTPRFEDADGRGRFRVVSFHAKRARGEMASWLVTRRVRTVSALARFDGAGYRFAPDVSAPDQPVFRRRG